jgi:hypothetical protein
LGEGRGSIEEVAETQDRGARDGTERGDVLGEGRGSQPTNSFEVQTAAPPLLHPRYNTVPASLQHAGGAMHRVAARCTAHAQEARGRGEAVQSRYRTSRNVPQLPRSRHWSHATGTGRRGQRNQRWGLLGGGWSQPSSGPGLAWILWYNSSVGFHRSGSAQYRPVPLLQLTNGTPVAVAPLRLRIATGTLCIPPPRTLRSTARHAPWHNPDVPSEDRVVVHSECCHQHRVDKLGGYDTHGSRNDRRGDAQAAKILLGRLLG